jgi:hypothetical protein
MPTTFNAFKSFKKQYAFKKQALQSRSKAVASIPELAVILIVLGLMVSAFATFSKIIGIAKANSIIRDYSSLKESVYSFKATYSFAPGDLISSEKILATGELDGNGDGLISWGQTTKASNASANESFNFYRHLKASGVLPDISTANPITADTTISTTVNQNVLRSNIQGAGLVPVSFATSAGYQFANTANSFTLVFGQVTTFTDTDGTVKTGRVLVSGDLAGLSSADAVKANAPFINQGSVEADILKAVDKKIDDEVPTSGNFKYDATMALPVAGFLVNF